MKLFYKITVSITIASVILVLVSVPYSPVATLGIYLFGTYDNYLGAILLTLGISAVSGLIGFIWAEF